MAENFLKTTAAPSGWLRLLFVLSIAWLVLCSYWGYSMFPTESSIQFAEYTGWKTDLQNLDAEITAIQTKCSDMNTDNLGRINALVILCWKNQNLEGARAKKVQAERAMRESIRAQVEELPRIQAMVIAKALLLWFLPSLLAYVALAWVSAGFRKP